MRRQLTCSSPINLLVIALLAALVAACALFAVQPASAHATSKTADQAIAWCKSKVGQALDYDGNSAQCVDLTKYYYRYLGVSAVHGNGKDYASNPLPSGWTRTKGGTPQKGDILVYTKGKYGHVAIYESGTVTYHQNYGGQYVRRITGKSYKSFCSGTYWGCIHPNFSGGTSSANNNPTGYIDVVSSPAPGQIRVAGWAFDPNSTSQSLQVHVYVGGAAGSSSAEGNSITANKSREDVNKAYSISGKHGYDATINTAKSGSVTVYIYAINVGSGENVLLGSKTVKVTSGDPTGYVDAVTSPGSRKVRVRGWAFDPNSTSKSLQIHVYIGGPAGSSDAEGYGNITANQSRADVNRAYSISGKHGFDATINTNMSGTVKVYIYAINVGAGTNKLIGTKTVKITYATPVTIANGVYMVRFASNTSYVWDIYGASASNNAKLTIYPAKSTDVQNQRFRFRRQSNGSYTIMCVQSGKYVDAYGCGKTNGTSVVQYTGNKQKNQQWYIEKNSDGTYSFRGVDSSLYLHLASGKVANGNPIHLWQGTGTNARWTLTLKAL